MSWLLPLIALTTAGLLLSRPLRKNRAWRATVTPLASIIGSGFLVVAPILGHLLGIYAFLGMLLITLLAIEIGEVIRFNIRHAEPLIGQGGLSPSAEWTERTANLTLTLSYVVSVAFYLRLLSAFVLRAFGMEADFQADVLTTVILASIGIVGWRWGLHALENLEEYSVSIKLAVIAALLAGLGVHDVGTGFDLSGVGSAGHDLWEIVRVLGGLLLVVQGFETSRYLGNEYSADLRIRSMRRAQWLSTVIYLVFVLLVTPLLGLAESAHVDETAVIDLAAQAAWILGPMLVLAAVMSQFSAAVADTVGAGGLVEEESGRRIRSRIAYPVIAVLAIVLVWTANLFEIISLASRAFAFYYLLQTLLAMQLSHRIACRRGRVFCRLRFGGVALVLLFVVLLGKPVG